MPPTPTPTGGLGARSITTEPLFSPACRPIPPRTALHELEGTVAPPHCEGEPGSLRDD